MIQARVNDAVTSMRHLVTIEDDAKLEWLFCLASFLQASLLDPPELLPTRGMELPVLDGAQVIFPR